MKTPKSTIAIIVLSIAFTLSFAFNIFITNILGIHDSESFKQVLLGKELLESLEDLTVEVPDVEIAYPEDNQTSDTTESTTPESQPENDNPATNNPTTDTTTQTGKVIFNENNIKITYVSEEDGLVGPAFKFYIENNSNKPIDVSFTDVYIDDYQADLSGGYVYGLGAGRKVYQNLTLWKSDYEDFTASPSKVEFVIKIYDPDIWDPIVETDYITINR